MNYNELMDFLQNKHNIKLDNFEIAYFIPELQYNDTFNAFETVEFTLRFQKIKKYE